MNRKKCSIELCKYPIFGKGYCSLHQYLRTDKKPKEAKPKKPIKKISDKHKQALSIYSKLARKYKTDNPECQAKLNGCTFATEDVHHMAKRGKNLNNVETWLAVCRSCHEIIENQLSSEDAREKGLRL
jgi:uncharacterized Zn finger protein (UPF0148 family)